MTLHVPTITENDLRAFHSRHFAGCPFPAAFFLEHKVAGDSVENYGDDDGLDSYEDGVKRTLTDEQIAMFRHSEIQALLTERRRRREAAEEDEDVESPNESVTELVEVSRPTVVLGTAFTEDTVVIERLTKMTTESVDVPSQPAESRTKMVEEPRTITAVPQPPIELSIASPDAVESPAMTSTETPSSNQPDSDGELPTVSESRKRKVPTNRNKQTRKRLKLKKHQKQQEKLQAEKQQKAQEPEDFTPRRIAREQDEVVHANVDLDYD